MIPKVRPWLVRFVRDGATVAEIRVETVNRRFAWWLALDNLPKDLPLFGSQVKISRTK